MTKQERTLKLVELYKEVDEYNRGKDRKPLIERAREGLLRSENFADQTILLFAESLEYARRTQIVFENTSITTPWEAKEFVGNSIDSIRRYALEFSDIYKESIEESCPDTFAEALRELFKAMLSMEGYALFEADKETE